MKKYNIGFSQKFSLTVFLSVALVLGSLGVLFTKGLNYGVDFRGGAEVQVKFEKSTSASDVRQAVEESKVKVSSIQSIGGDNSNEFLIKLPASKDDINKITDTVTSGLTSKLAANGPEIRKTDIVGPKAGEELRNSSFQAMAWALLFIMVYIGLRFDFKYSPGAIVALFHDVVIILGIFSLTGREFSLQIVAALLAVIGYSVNDTVVVYDRVREHEEKTGGKLKAMIDIALNETLNRTVLTSLTTLIVSLCMFFMGGGIIHDFFFAITLGVIIGTYSSLFVAAPTVLIFDKFQSKA